MKSGKVETVLQENMMLKEELSRLIGLIKENEVKYKGFRLVEDAFLLSESLSDMDAKALKYMEEIFDLDKAALFVNGSRFPKEMTSRKYERIFCVDEKIFKYAYIEKRPYFGNRLEDLISEFRIDPQAGSFLTAPVVENGTIIASLNMYTRDPERFTDEGNSDFVRDLMLRVGISLKKLEDTHNIKKQAQYDHLTGLYNKGMMFPLLQQKIEEIKENDSSFTFVLLDMDHFKQLNDTHGHFEGDNALKTLTQGFSELMKSGESFGRFGGDEFYMIMNDTSENIINSRFDDIMKVVDSVAVKYEMLGRLSISGGYVRIPQDIQPSIENLAEIVKLADVGLYQSKARDRQLCGINYNEKQP